MYLPVCFDYTETMSHTIQGHLFQLVMMCMSEGDHCLRLFMNSILVGCVCAVCDDDGVVFITDCVLPVGCEGAPVYCKTSQ